MLLRSLAIEGKVGGYIIASWPTVPRTRLEDWADFALRAEYADAEETEDLVFVLQEYAYQFRLRADWEQSRRASGLAAALSRRTGLREEHARSLILEAETFVITGELEWAALRFAEATAVTNSPEIHDICEMNSGVLRLLRGDYEEGLASLERACAAFDAEGSDWALWALCNWALALTERGSVWSSQSKFEQLFQRPTDNPFLWAVSQMNYAQLQITMLNPESATLMLASAYRYFTENHNRAEEVNCLKLMGDLSEQQRDISTALWHYRRGLRLAKKIGIPLGTLRWRIRGLES